MLVTGREIAFDCDGVLGLFMEQVVEYSKKFDNKHLSIDSLTSGDFRELGWDNVYKFFEDTEYVYGFYRSMDVDRGVLALIKDLIAAGNNVYIVTSVKGYFAVKARIEWLLAFGLENICISVIKDPFKFDYIVDDGLFNLKTNTSTERILFKKNWNSLKCDKAAVLGVRVADGADELRQLFIDKASEGGVAC